MSSVFEYQWTDALTLPMTRYDMVSMVYNLLAAKQAAMPGEEAISATTRSLLDWSEVSVRYQGTVRKPLPPGFRPGKKVGRFRGTTRLLAQKRQQSFTGCSRLVFPDSPEEKAEYPAMSESGKRDR